MLKSARLVIIARAKEWLKVSFSPLPFNNNNNNNRNGYKFVVLVITDAYAMHKQTKNALATSGTIATLFSDEEFYFEALAAGSVSEFREAMCRFLYRHGGDDDGNGQPQERTFSLLETTLIEEEADREQRKAYNDGAAQIFPFSHESRMISIASLRNVIGAISRTPLKTRLHFFEL